MVHNNNGRRFSGKEDAHLVEDFEPRPGTFRIGLKSLNINTVAAAKGNPCRVLLAAGRDLTREIPAEKDAACVRIYPHLSCNNYVLAGPPDAEGIASLAVQLMGEAGVLFPVRKDCIMGIEVVFSLPDTTSVNIRAYFEAALAWMREEFAPAPIICAVVHLDEPHPHMHVLVLPLIDGSMQGGKVAGYKATFNRRKRDFYLDVAKDFGLAEPVVKPSFSKAQRQAYAVKVVETLVEFLPGRGNEKLVRDELLKLVIRDPYSLGRALGVQVAAFSQSHVAGSVSDTSANIFDVHSAEGDRPDTAASTSCLCSDVDAASKGKGTHPARDSHSHSPHAPILTGFKHFDDLPDSENVRQSVVQGLFGCSAATVWRGVKSGRIPSPVHLAGRVTAWNVGELRRALKIAAAERDGHHV